MGESRGSIGFFTTYRPPVPLDIYSNPIKTTLENDEELMTDAHSYNYNGQQIPPAALKVILGRPMLAGHAKPEDVDLGRVSGLVFVSERNEGLEILHIALRNLTTNPIEVKVFNFADVYDTFNGVRLEDHPCFAGDYIVYVSTKDNPIRDREPWNAVYKTHLATGETERLTPAGVADFSPAVSPSGKKIAIATLEFKESGWDGEIEDLKTDIVVMNMDSQQPNNRTVVVENGGWPTWGDENTLFFHRRMEIPKIVNGQIKKDYIWGVFRIDITLNSMEASRVTSEEFNAMTPVAIDSTRVVVATIRDKKDLGNNPREKVDEYRHIEIFDFNQPQNVTKITQKTNPWADHYNPFVLKNYHGFGEDLMRIGFHRCNRDHLKEEDMAQHFQKVKTPEKEVGAFRVSGVFPTFSKDGKKLAFVDNEFRNVWLADDQGLRIIHTMESPDGVFSPVWNQNAEIDILYVCVGPSFHANHEVVIGAICDASSGQHHYETLNKGFDFMEPAGKERQYNAFPSTYSQGELRHYNNAFPSSDPQGKKLVFRSTRANHKKGYKNLYIMDAKYGEYARDAKVTRLTEGEWTDTHCQWSPNGDWIVFSSSRDRPPGTQKRDDMPDPGYFGVYLINANHPNPKTAIRVIGSGMNGSYLLPGHVNHPFFSPDSKSIVFASDLAGVSVDPISLPLFLHSVRSYGDIFSVDINLDEITDDHYQQRYQQQQNLIKMFTRLTHSRYENSTPSWTILSTDDSMDAWHHILPMIDQKNTGCPIEKSKEPETWYFTGHLCIPKRCC